MTTLMNLSDNKLKMEREWSFLVHVPEHGACMLSFNGQGKRRKVSLLKIALKGPLPPHSAANSIDLGGVLAVSRALVLGRTALRVRVSDPTIGSVILIVPRYKSDIDRVLLLCLASQQSFCETSSSSNEQSTVLRREMLGLSQSKLFPTEFDFMPVHKLLDSEAVETLENAQGSDSRAGEGCLFALGNTQLCIAQSVEGRLVLEKPVPYAQVVRVHMMDPQSFLVQLSSGRILGFKDPKLDIPGLVLTLLGKTMLQS